MSDGHLPKEGLIPLTLAALGVVFGDIGTSPLYALRECFHGPHALPLNQSNVLGILSLILWSLIIVITIKYLVFVLRADNKGEGGILALMALVAPHTRVGGVGAVTVMGLFGAALLYGDGVITPAISVLSAVEGLKVATPLFEPFVLVITTIIIVGLFLLQGYGTSRLGKTFGPIVLLWFLALAVLGIRGIVASPDVLIGVNPFYAIEFFLNNGWHGFVVLGSVFLVVTGGEALYADLGHFGKRSIQAGWFFVALPSLILQYFGQGALLLTNAAAVSNPFYFLAPGWALYPLVILATFATVLASQAVITGAFSLSQQAIQLGYLPRMAVKYTSSKEKGQIYIPFINWALLFGTLYLVFEFKTSSELAAAYGIAVTSTMFITTVLTYLVMRRKWRWSRGVAVPLVLFFLIVDLGFLGANIIKIPDGGWFPLALGCVIFVAMTTWKTGRKILADRLGTRSIPLETFMGEVLGPSTLRVPGTAIFMTAATRGTPPALVRNVKHNRVLHDQVVILTLLTADVPHVEEVDLLKVEDLGKGFFRVVVGYGFMQKPDVPQILRLCRQHRLSFEPHMTTFFLGRETLISTSRPGMAPWRERLFVFMSRNAQRATDYFQIPSDQAIEIGTVVEL